MCFRLHFLAIGAIPKQSTGNVLPDRSKVLAFPGADGAGNIPPVVPEVLYTLLLPLQTTVRKEHFAGLSARKVPAPLSLRLAELLNYKKH